VPRRKHVPADLRSSRLEVGDQEILVLSYPLASVEPDPLAPAEAEVARLAAEGHSNAQIARARGTSVRTVANQMAKILEKLGLSSRRALAALYRNNEARNAVTRRR
jgi:DNA-binding CsgD family transcriptional regulator